MPNVYVAVTSVSEEDYFLTGRKVTFITNVLIKLNNYLFSKPLLFIALYY